MNLSFLKDYLPEFTHKWLGISTPAKPEVKRDPLMESAEAIIVAVVLALVIIQFGIQAFKIPSGSMKQTLLIGDQILVNKFKYGPKIPFTDKYLFRWKDPKRGEVIVFRYPKDMKRDFIKRIVGVPGDVISVKNKQLYVNNVAVKENYIQFTDVNEISNKRDMHEEIVVPPDHFFVMGDNRDNSEDSRFWGFVPRENIKGMAFMVYFSWDHSIKRNWGILAEIPGLNYLAFDGAPRWSRTGRIIEQGSWDVPPASAPLD